jgi:hypothetical protein
MDMLFCLGYQRSVLCLQVFGTTQVGTALLLNSLLISFLSSPTNGYILSLFILLYRIYVSYVNKARVCGCRLLGLRVRIPLGA